MQLTPLSVDASTPNDALAMDLIAAIGAKDFAAHLIAAVHPALPVNHCTVFALQGSGRVEVVSSASVIGDVATVTAQAYADMGFDRQDSNMVWLSRRKTAQRVQYWLGHQFAEDVANAQYRRVCYGETGIRERLSLLVLFPDGYRVAISLYRNHAYADFSPADLTWLRGAARWIGATVRQHVGLRSASPAAAAPGPLQGKLMALLSGRERELVSHVLDGCTTKEAAQRMGIAQTTALTYRYRAFARLDVRNQRELLSRVHRDTAAPGGWQHPVQAAVVR